MTVGRLSLCHLMGETSVLISEWVGETGTERVGGGADDSGGGDDGRLGGGHHKVIGFSKPVVETRPCVVICDLRPGWAWALEGLPFEVTTVAFGSGAGRRWLPGSCHNWAIGVGDLPTYVDQLTFIAGPAKFVNKILHWCEFGCYMIISVEGPPRGLRQLGPSFGHLVVPHKLVGA
jgi:hypothetical protein